MELLQGMVAPVGMAEGEHKAVQVDRAVQLLDLGIDRRFLQKRNKRIWHKIVTRNSRLWAHVTLFLPDYLTPGKTAKICSKRIRQAVVILSLKMYFLAFCIFNITLLTVVLELSNFC